MMQLQNDNLNLHARTALPRMLAALEKQDLSLFESRNLQVLQEWNYMNHRDSIAPIIWDRWWDNFQRLVWEDECYSEQCGRLLFPRRDVTVDLVLNDSASSFL
ncbi:MAG: penicillin acylase family protein [Calditrichae bacterium]|nr:penicillin acylase family protein [Calditrichia bacterium]